MMFSLGIRSRCTHHATTNSLHSSFGSLSALGLMMSTLVLEELWIAYAISDDLVCDGMPFMLTSTRYLNVPTKPMIR